MKYLLLGALLACSTESRAPVQAPQDTTAVRPDSDRHDGDGDHHDGQHGDKHKDKEHGKKP